MSNNPLETLTDGRDHVMSLVREADVKSMPFWTGHSIRLLRILIAIFRDLSDGQLNLRAMSLVYTTLLSLVPLLAISFSVLKGFGVHNQIEPMLLQLLEPLGQQGVEIAAKVISFVDNIKVGVLGSVGLGLLLYSVISLMQKIERAFNYTWNISESRRFAARFSDYLSVLLVGPLLMFVSVGIKASISNADFVQKVTGIELFGGVFNVMGILMPWLFLTAAFAFIYMFMPNTRVRVGSALAGGAVTALMWKMLGFLFATFVASSTSYAAIYSAFATLILFMIWLYLGWLVVLIGASISFYIQNPMSQILPRGDMRLSSRVREKMGLMICCLVGESHYQGKLIWTDETLSVKLRVPMRSVRKIAAVLEDGGILAQTKTRKAVYIPACPFEEMPVSDVLEILTRAYEDKGVGYVNMASKGSLDKVLKRKETHVRKAMGKTVLKDLLTLKK